MVVFGAERYFYYSSCVKKDRSQTPCYWENQPVGCTKPHCIFKHFKPRPFSFDQPQTGTAGKRWIVAPCSAMVNMKSDKSAVQVMSLEETLRQRALDSMMRARGSQVDSRRVVVEQEQEEPQPPAKKSLSARVHDRLGAYVFPKETPPKTNKRQPAPLIVHRKVIDSDVELDYSDPCRRPLTASLESDNRNEEETVMTTLRKRRLTPITSPEEFSDQEAVTVPPKKKSIPAAYFEDEPVIPHRKSLPHKRTLAPITNFDDCHDGATAVLSGSGKKRKSIFATEKATANEPHVLSLEEILRRKKLKQQQEQHEDTATKKVATVPARHSKAERQIYVPPSRMNAGVSSVKAANVWLPTDTSVVQTRLAEPSAVVIKTFSLIMAEKRTKRQLERQQQQQRKTSSQQEKKVSSQQENNGSGEEASKKPFHFQPIVSSDSVGDGLNKCVGGFSRVAQNGSPVFTSSPLSLPQPAHRSSLPQPAPGSSQLQPAPESSLPQPAPGSSQLQPAHESSLPQPAPESSQLQPAHELVTSTAPSSLVSPCDSSASSRLSETGDNLHLKAIGELLCDDDDFHKLLMDLDHLLD